MITVTATHPSFETYTARVTQILEWLVTKETSGDASLEVFLVPDEKMNTNVLAYPEPKNFPRPDITSPSLGEIYLNPDYIARNDESLDFMLIHGFLHLLGYDHKKKDDRIKMEARETALLSELPA